MHGIGKGILVAEIQESSNVTYRIYDYDCVDKNGKIQTMDAEQKTMRFSKDETLFLPAGLGRCLVVGDAELIKVRC